MVADDPSSIASPACDGGSLRTARHSGEAAWFRARGARALPVRLDFAVLTVFAVADQVVGEPVDRIAGGPVEHTELHRVDRPRLTPEPVRGAAGAEPRGGHVL